MNDLITYHDFNKILIGILGFIGTIAIVVLGHHLKKRREDMRDQTNSIKQLQDMTIEELSHIKASQGTAKVAHANIEKKLDKVEDNIGKLYDRTEQNGKNIVKLEALIKKNGK